jgi:hypothetical protein
MIIQVQLSFLQAWPQPSNNNNLNNLNSTPQKGFLPSYHHHHCFFAMSFTPIPSSSLPNLDPQAVMDFSLSLVQAGPDNCHFWTASPPHAYSISLLHVYITFVSIALLLIKGATAHLLDPFTHFQTVPLWSTSEQCHVLQQYIPDPSTMFHPLPLDSKTFPY